MDTNDTSAPASAQTIRVIDINPLLQLCNLPDTANNVRIVLHLLQAMALAKGFCSDDETEAGLSYIHMWLETSLDFAAKHPNVTEVIPVKRASGGAS